ncbi:hypothetical protein Tco_0501895 [Tanacetum coccineum]
MMSEDGHSDVTNSLALTILPMRRRVLVEVDAGKEYLDKIEINYVDAMKKVFVHTDNYCKAKQKKERNDASQEAKVNGNKEDNEGFVEVINRKNKQGSKKRYVVKQKKIPNPNSKEGEIGINKSTQDTGKSCETSNGDKREGDMYKKNNMGNTCNMTPPSLEKIWNVGPKKIMELRKSANKFDVLSKGMNNLEFDGDVSQEERRIIDIWNDVNGLDESSDEEDIIEENNAANVLVADEIEGGDSQLLN